MLCKIQRKKIRFVLVPKYVEGFCQVSAQILHNQNLKKRKERIKEDKKPGKEKFKSRLHILFTYAFYALNCILEVLTLVHLCLWKPT